MNEEILDPWCLALPQEYSDARDFKAEQALKVDEDVKLPESFSLGKWIRETNYQWSIWSCTANSTSHWVQVLAVAKKWVVPTDKNIITPDWKNLWRNMWHSPEKYDGWDYLEKAVRTALDNWILSIENGEVITFDAYCTMDWDGSNKCIETMKRYLYGNMPIVRCMRWNKSVRNQLSAWQLKKWIKIWEDTGWHAICLVWWDKDGFRFVNSWMKNDKQNPPHKSRFHVPYDVLKLWKWMFNWRMWILYTEIDALKDPEYLKRKNTALIILKALRKCYPDEDLNVKKAIEWLSSAYRKAYPELNDEYPVE